MTDSTQRRQKELAKLISQSEKEMSEIEKLKEQFPDLEVKTDRWKKRRYAAKSANQKVEKYYTGFSCGCCSDSPYFVYPYLEVDGVYVHSSPERFYAGERSYYAKGGVVYDDSVLEQLEKNNISTKVADRVKFLVSTAPDYYDDEEDDW